MALWRQDMVLNVWSKKAKKQRKQDDESGVRNFEVVIHHLLSYLRVFVLWPMAF